MRVINAILGVFSILVLLLMLATYVFSVTLDQQGPLAKEKIVVIESGGNIRDIADTLVKEGVINDTWSFVLGSIVLRGGNSLKAGEYAFKPGISIGKVIDLIKGGHIFLRRINFPEGWTSSQIIERLRDNPLLTGEITEIPPEGSMFPASYDYSRGESRAAIIKQMRQTRDRLVKKIWRGRQIGLPLKNIDEMVVLASIIEKETSVSSERGTIAAVFINRLNKGMRLQADPTVIYGLFAEDGGELNKTLTRSDLTKYTPYNTYRIAGLPPTPIANPGVESLRAAVNPDDSNALYFVADGSGGHVFSATLNQHRKNVNRWRKLNEQKNG